MQFEVVRRPGVCSAKGGGPTQHSLTQTLSLYRLFFLLLLLACVVMRSV